MSKIKRNRVIGARGIGVVNGNLNSGFDGNPKTLSNGDFTNSDVSTKFLDRDFWENTNEKVLIKKRIKEDEAGNLYACTLEEIIYDRVDVSRNVNAQILNDYVDVQNFGAAITVSKINLGTTGVCQYYQGINKIKSSQVLVQEILSPFGTGNNKKNKTKAKSKSENAGDSLNATEESKLSTATNIGKSTFVDKALYVQSFSVNPENLNNLAASFKDEEILGYKEENYEKFKKAVLHSATLYNTRSKAGCYDEFSIFVNIKEGSYFSIADLGRFIDVIHNEDEDKVVIDFNKLEFLNEVEDVESIEIFYNALTCDIEHSFNNAIVKNLLCCY